MTKEAMTAAKAAKLLNVSEDTIHQWLKGGEPNTAAPPAPESPAPEVSAKKEAMYTANSLLRRAFAASQIMDADAPEQPNVPDAILGQAISAVVSEEHPEAASAIATPMAATALSEAEIDAEVPPPEVVAEVAQCISLIADTKTAFASAFNVSSTLMQRGAIEVLDALRNDLAALVR